jgi:5-methylcytosine-specific restriction endonuclease McrA
VAEAIKALGEAGAQLNLTLREALVEKAEELRHRAFFRLIPDARLRDRQIPAFVELVMGSTPSQDLVERVTVVQRGVRLSTDEVLSLEAKQNYRCALCGTPLTRVAHPAVDHVHPIALGGKNTMENYQLLCRLCNVGKGKLPGWMVGVPYLTTRISARLRYSVLARYESRCQFGRCLETSRTSLLEVRPQIPGSQGGRLIFDNLFVLCEHHARRREVAARRRALDELRLNRRHRRAAVRRVASRPKPIT